MTTCRFCNEAHGEGECLSESIRTMPCACRFEWRENPDFSGKPPVPIGACGYHATQLREFNAELAAQSRELASLRAKAGILSDGLTYIRSHMRANEILAIACMQLNEWNGRNDATAAYSIIDVAVERSKG